VQGCLGEKVINGVPRMEVMGTKTSYRCGYRT
jgi:hypothetical protein